jgi:spoIIIJ-associated protein
MLEENSSALAAEQTETLLDETAVAKEVLETLLSNMGIAASVQVVTANSALPENTFVLNIVGTDLGILIGRRGEALRDLEFVARLVTSQRTGKPGKFVVDVGNYRTRRETVLRELAKRMAERVQASGRPITLEAMPPYERRIVHLTLGEHPAVTTQSIGEGEHRRVMIIPK